MIENIKFKIVTSGLLPLICQNAIKANMVHEENIAIKEKRDKEPKPDTFVFFDDHLRL